MRCNTPSVNSALRIARALNDPYGSDELNLPLADRYNAGVLDMTAIGLPHVQTSPFGFSTATRQLIQLEGPFTFSITLSASSSSNLSTTFCFLLNEILHMACAIGVTLSSTFSFNWKCFNFPRPVNTCGYLAFRAAFLSLMFLYSQAFTDAPTFRKPNSSEELLPSSVSVVPGITKKFRIKRSLCIRYTNVQHAFSTKL